MNKSSVDRLTKVHPLLRDKIILLTSEFNRQFAGLSLEVVQGVRTFAEQDALFAKGRTKPGKIVTNARAGQSFHNYGLAVDVCPFRDGAPLWTEDKYFDALAAFARRFNLEWGGDWNTPDRPHLQLRGFKNWREAKTIYDGGGIERVWLEASRRNGV